jgi:hypothetical protein
MNIGYYSLQKQYLSSGYHELSSYWNQLFYSATERKKKSKGRGREVRKRIRRIAIAARFPTRI